MNTLGIQIPISMDISILLIILLIGFTWLLRIIIRRNHIKLIYRRWSLNFNLNEQRPSNYLLYYSTTILSVLFAIWLYQTEQQQTLQSLCFLDTVFIAVGGLIGTILALVFSLSIIPIQNATEIFSPSIIRLYKNDRVTQFIFNSLTFFCFLSFCLILGGSKLKFEIAIPIQMIILALSLDFVRWHHRHIIKLLNPNEAIKKLSGKAKDYIKQTQTVFSKMTKELLQKKTDASVSHLEIESGFYQQMTYYYKPINSWSDELTEIAKKAIAKNETYLAKLAIYALNDIACYYLEVRKNNLILVPNSNLIFDTDLNLVLKNTYENFKDINQTAITFNAEISSIHVIEALGGIVDYTVNLNSPKFPKCSAPITWLPLGYLTNCIKAGQLNKFDDLALQGSQKLLKIAIHIPENLQITDVWIPLIKAWQEISYNFLISNKWTLCNEVLNDLMGLAYYAIESNHHQANRTIQKILESIQPLIPYALTYEKQYGPQSIQIPLSPIYDLTQPKSIGYLITLASSNINKNETRDWIDPYSDFESISELIFKHFKLLSRRTDIGQSYILKNIIDNIHQISKTYLLILDWKIPNKQSYVNKLVEQINWYQSVIWEAFVHASSIDFNNAEQACDITAWIGMSFFEREFTIPIQKSILNINTIVHSYIKKAKDLKDYDIFQIADLLLYIWYLELYTSKHGTSSVKLEIDNLKNLTQIAWKDVEITIALRKAKFEESLNDDDDDDDDEKSLGLLRKKLKES